MSEKPDTFFADLDELNRRRWFMDARGYRPCNIPACNCPYWHGGHLEDRFREIQDALDEGNVNTNGITILDAIKGLIAKAEGRHD